MALSAFWIKIIALATMVLDHIGLFFYPHEMVWRLAGRLSFPLFAWLVALGSRHTRDIDVYLNRLLVLAVLTQPLYLVARQTVNPLYFGLNPLFGLFLGLLAVKGFSRAKDAKLKTAAIAACCIAALAFGVDYGAVGVLSIVVFYVFWDDKIKSALALAGLYGISFLISMFPPLFFGLKNIGIDNAMEFTALLALVVIFTYNKEQGPKLQYLFYLFYPLQFIIVFVVKLVLK